jgi:hypothetical protein
MFNKKLGLIALLAGITGGELWAGTLANYAIGDVLICFRKSASGNDLVVDAGPVSTFINFPANSTNTITQYTGAQLALVGTNGISWSAFTWFDDTVSPASAQWTLFVSKARTSLNTKTAAWSASSAAAQEPAALDMSSIPPGAKDNSGFKVQNTATAIVEPDDPNNSNSNYHNGQSYVGTLGPNFDFTGDFQGNPENTTANNFTLAGVPVRSDFYQIPPSDGGGGPVKFLGYFQLSTNGVITYVAYPAAAIAAPAITLIVRTGTTNTITFTTGPGGTYSLRGTNDLTVSRTNWPVITSTPGNGSPQSLKDVTTNSTKFYIISAQ